MRSSNFAIQRGFDWITLSIYLALLCTSWFMVYASGYSETDPGFSFSLNSNIGKHTLFILISVFAFFLAYLIDTKFWHTMVNLNEGGQSG